MQTRHHWRVFAAAHSAQAPPTPRSPCAYPSRRRPDTRKHQCQDLSCDFNRADQRRQRDRVHCAVKMQTTTTLQAQLNCGRWRRLGGRAMRHRSPSRDRNIHWIEKSPSARRPKPFLLQVMPPRINLLPPNLMTLRHLGHARPADTNRHDNLELVVVMPEAPPLHPKNFAPHRTPRIKDVANDVIKHVS